MAGPRVALWLKPIVGQQKKRGVVIEVGCYESLCDVTGLHHGNYIYRPGIVNPMRLLCKAYQLHEPSMDDKSQRTTVEQSVSQIQTRYTGRRGLLLHDRTTKGMNS